MPGFRIWCGIRLSLSLEGLRYSFVEWWDRLDSLLPYFLSGRAYQMVQETVRRPHIGESLRFRGPVQRRGLASVEIRSFETSRMIGRGERLWDDWQVLWRWHVELAA